MFLKENDAVNCCSRKNNKNVKAALVKKRRRVMVGLPDVMPHKHKLLTSCTAIYVTVTGTGRQVVSLC